jgi:hypothetical protein
LFSDLFAVLVLVSRSLLMLFFALVLIPVLLLAGCPYDGEALWVRVGIDCGEGHDGGRCNSIDYFSNK